MSKYIRMTEEQVQQARAEFEEYLSGLKMTDGKISFNKTVGTIARRAKLKFSDLAWAKMNALVRNFDKEVAWHGVAYRGEDENKDEYIVEDILVYPQTVTGSTVEMDEAEYAKWLQENDDDDRFFNIRMQGHSHVNMATSPSSVDLQHQEAILANVRNNGFYIFVIWNKRGEKNIKIYDMMKNILFETADVDVEVSLDDAVSAFVKDAKEIVKDRVYAATVTTPPTQSVYQGYYGRGYYDDWLARRSGKKGGKNAGKNTGKKQTKGAFGTRFLDEDDDDDDSRIYDYWDGGYDY